MDREIKKKNPRLRKALLIAVPALLLAGVVVWAVSRATSTVYRADSAGLL